MGGAVQVGSALLGLRTEPDYLCCCLLYIWCCGKTWLARETGVKDYAAQRLAALQ